MSLMNLVSLADDIPWCGTVPRPPVRVAPPPHFLSGGTEERSDSRDAMLGPHPEPWRAATVRAALAASIRLAQLGRQMDGESGRMMMSAASDYYDDTCGNVPFSTLLQLILHGPPPAPDPWLDRLISLGNTLVFAQQGGLEQMAAAASRQLATNLKAVQSQT